MRDIEFPDPNPIIIGGKAAYTSSRQVSDYLLCKDCEERFRRGGEDWVLAQMYRIDGTFPFRDKLANSKPEFSAEGFSAYRGVEVPELEWQSLIYFGMSVFWRAATHEWPWHGGRVHIDVGPYLEPMRLFLMSEAGFPDNMSLIVRMSDIDSFRSMALLPTSERHDGYHMHKFMIPGLMFLLAIGGRIPRSLQRVSLAPSELRYVVINAPGEFDDITAIAARAQSVKPPRRWAR